MTVSSGCSGGCDGSTRLASAYRELRPRSTRIGGASVAVRAGDELAGKAASLRCSAVRSRGGRKPWRPPRITVICGWSAVAEVTDGVVLGGRAASLFGPAFVGCRAAGGGLSLDFGAARKIRGRT